MRSKLIIAAILLVALAGCKKDGPAPVKKKPVAKPDTIADNGSIKLQLLNEVDTLQHDDALLVFDHTTSAKYILGEDAPYHSGLGPESLAFISSDGFSLAIDYRPYKPGMIIGLNVGSTNSTGYTLRVIAATNVPASIHFWLKDNYKKDSTDLRLGAYAFIVMKTDTNTYGAGRFKLLLK